MAHSFELTPQGPFDLAAQRLFFGGWPVFEPDPGALAMAFPVEGWSHSAVVVLQQGPTGVITGTVHGPPPSVAESAWRQALGVLSLDVDGSGFPSVGERDPAVGRLGRAHTWMRPVLFHSPYEAACNFVIGQRISQVQARALRRRMGEESGDRIEVDGATLTAFPRPQQLLELAEVRSLPEEKLTRLHAVARAALDGVLDRQRLRSMAVPAALAELSAIRGIGPFSAQGILHRGAGLVDEVTDDPVSKQAVQRLYGLDHLPTQEEVLRRAQPWRPYRMWALVLLHVWIRGEGGGAAQRFRRPGQGSRPW